MVDRGSLWGLVLKSKYGGVLDSPNVRQSQMESIWWRDIMDVCGDRRERSWFNDNITWKVGDGRRLCFLHHLWVGNEPLGKKYKRLYLNSTQQGDLVGEVGCWLNGVWSGV